MCGLAHSGMLRCPLLMRQEGNQWITLALLRTNQIMKSIDEHIAKDQDKIAEARAKGDEAMVRHLEEELESLKEFKDHHPEDDHDPTSLEMYCENNPEAAECRIYDD
ncbi:MAG: hypothetical protein RLZZ430_739 [Cyanobacteriota bacterium]|jgi:hypothetical protein